MEESKRILLALNKSGSAVYEWCTKSNTISWSGNVYDVLEMGQSVRNAMKIASKDGYLSLLNENDKSAFLSSIEEAVTKGGDYSRNYSISVAGGKTINIFDRGTITDADGKKLMVGVISRLENTAVKKTSSTKPAIAKARKTLEINSLYHNNEFLEALNNAFKRSEPEKDNNVLLKISIDNLPMIIKWYSMELAEQIMTALEVDISKLIRSHDIIKRLSMEHFGVILLGQSEGEAELVVDNILKKIQFYQHPDIDDPINIRTSVGSVSFPSAALTPEDAMDKAFLAMINVRSKASEFYSTYESTKQEYAGLKEQISKMHFLQNALNDNKLTMAYQPIISSKDGSTGRYECLLRIIDGKGGATSAGTYIATAEKMGFIDLIDMVVLEKIVEELKANKDICLSFNVSNLTTDNPKWLKQCNKLLSDSNVAERIVVEVTETAAHKDMRQTAYFVAALQALGCKIALDDFGAGYTSFRQLKSLSVDMVKIDGSYIFNLVDRSEDQLFIKTLIEFTRSYGLETIAESVESGEIAKILIELGVDYMQGYYFGRPDIKKPWEEKKQHYA